MGSVDLTGLSAGFVLTDIFFLLLIGSLFSLAVLRMAQKRIRHGINYILYAAASTVLFIYVLKRFFL